MRLLDELRNNIITLEELKEKYGIKVREYDDRYVLNYDQINSSKYRFEYYVRVCRQLIIAKNFSSVLHRSFDRFFNYGEDPRTAEFDISKAVCEEKLDGSLIGFYHDGKEWCHCSKSLAYAEGPLSNSRKYKTFSDLIDGEINLLPIYSKGNKNYSYLFELMSQYNPLVTKPKDTKLYLLAVRNKITGEYVNRDIEGKLIGWEYYPKEYRFNTIDEIMKNVKELPISEEGYVCRIGDWRIKIKSPAHVAVSHMKDGILTDNKIIRIVYLCEEPEYLSYYPEDREFFEPFIKIRENMKKYFEDRFKEHYDENRASFAIHITILPPILRTILFKMWENGGRFEEAYKTLQDTKIEKLYKTLRTVML